MARLSLEPDDHRAEATVFRMACHKGGIYIVMRL